MWSDSQILVVVGLLLEFLSVAVAIRKLFWGYYKRLEQGTFRQGIEKDRREGMIIVVLLSIGMLLQGIAVFIE